MARFLLREGGGRLLREGGGRLMLDRNAAGTGALTSAPATLSGAATFVNPTYSGTGGLTRGGSVSLSGAATFTEPTYTGTGSLSASAASCRRRPPSRCILTRRLG